MAYISRLAEVLKKHKYVLLIVLIGVVFLLLPVGKEEEPEPPRLTETEESADINRELARILSQIDGAGKVEVMLTVSVGEETVYQSNEDHDNGIDTASWRTETVTVTDSDRNEKGLVKQVIPQKYLGAIVVCQGADKASVRLAVVEAVSCVTGLGADKISVWKMK